MGSRGDVMEAMLPALVARELDLSEPLFADALEPYMDTGNARVDHQVRGAIGAAENYRVVFEKRFRRGDELPRETIEYLYATAPSETMLTIQEAHGRTDPRQWRPVLWAEHQVSDVRWKWGYGFLDRDKVEPEAMEALHTLAVHPDWWARLYVAQVMKQHRPFRSESLIEMLCADADESVQAVMQEIVADEAKRQPKP
jgi:hypothetical protein